MKKVMSLILALLLCIALAVPAFANDDYDEFYTNGFSMVGPYPYYGMFGVDFESVKRDSESITFYSEETGAVTEDSCPVAFVKPGSAVTVEGGYAAGMEDVPEPPFRATVSAYKLRDDGSYELLPESVTITTGSIDDWGLGKPLQGSDDVVAMLELSGFGLWYVRLGETETEAPAASAPVAGVNVTVNGAAVPWTDAVPFIDENNRTMVPLRAVAEALGLTVSWDGAVREASFTDGNKTIFFPIGSSAARAEDGSAIQMDTAAVIVNDRTFAPIRYLAEYFGFTVGWDGATKTVVIQ